MSRSFTVMVHQAEDGSFWAQVKELPGCFATGDDLDELQEAVVEAIGMYLPELKRSPDKPPQVEPSRWKIEGNLTMTPA
jgi:predicted RNase H-like HicB family nuclease